jgi:hypothetical protein
MELGAALLTPAILPDPFACEFFAAEEVHFTPLHERDNKYRTAQMFPRRDPAIFVNQTVNQLLHCTILLAF